ncbi:MAG TPA: hypothetical protein DDY78_17725 [Planctomycetales bacterium]|jgi:hypothetical protein|nr:hypothetical protein [Planctomycetales bacterium]
MGLFAYFCPEATLLLPSTLDFLVAGLLASEDSLPKLLGHFIISLEKIADLTKQLLNFAHVLRTSIFHLSWLLCKLRTKFSIGGWALE